MLHCELELRRHATACYGTKHRDPAIIPGHGILEIFPSTLNYEPRAAFAACQRSISELLLSQLLRDL